MTLKMARLVVLSLKIIVAVFALCFIFSVNVSAQNCQCQGGTCSSGCSNAGTDCFQDPNACYYDPNVLPPGSGLYSSIAYLGTPAFWNKSIGLIIVSLIPYFYTIAGILLLIFLIYGGISLMTAQGDPKKVMAAKEMITGALVGFILVFSSYWIVQVVGYVLDIPALITIFG